MPRSIYDIMNDLQQKQTPFAVATVVDTYGSVSAKTSSKAVIDEHGRVISGWIGGGCAESSTCEQAVQCITSNETAMMEIDLNDEMLGAGMPCGGGMKVYVEPVLPEPTIWIMGHGKVAEVICAMGDILHYRIVVNDMGATADKFPAAGQIITDDIDYSQLKPKPSDYVIIATQHKGDHESIKQALSCDAGYIALIASRKRARLVLNYLREEGMTEDQISRVVAPSGIDLGPQTPEEIALCILSEITLLRRGGTGIRNRDKLLNDDAGGNTATIHQLSSLMASD
ncbi:XdhC family protein [Glaciecola siphonariae]|uniref:XdhC family protein n=1 Tax=Glaciecola siphonariae TaxID=521012 RepID=A0ABV9LYK7_9ALTE